MISLTVSTAMSISGCSRAFWRMQADRDTYDLTVERITDPRWDLPRIDIQPDPRSRFFDPYDPDKPPLPPDDSAAARYMSRAGLWTGASSWHKLGRAFSIENPGWLEPFGLSPTEAPAETGDGLSSASRPQSKTPHPHIDRLTLDQAIELSYIDSREYQTQIENVYLAALDLTFERFQFGVRYLGLGGREPTVDLNHETVPHGANNLGLNQRYGISQLLPSGAQWVVEFANNTLWLFTGRNRTSTASVLSYSIVQPLLMGAGRKVVLENLTQNERNVLYAVRDLARFRKTFFTDTVGAYLGLIEQRQRVLNERANVQRLKEQVEVLRALASQPAPEVTEPLSKIPADLKVPNNLAAKFGYDKQRKVLFWRGEMSKPQEKILPTLSRNADYQAAVKRLIQQLHQETVTLAVAQLLSQLANSESSLRSRNQQFQDRLDQFKLLIGLPPDMEITIDEKMLEPFELIDRRLAATQETVSRFVDVTEPLDETSTTGALRDVLKILEQLTQLVRKNGIDLVQSDIDRVKREIASRPADQRQQLDYQRLLTDVKRDRRLFGGTREAFVGVLTSVGRIGKLISAKTLTADQTARVIREISVNREDLQKILQNLLVIQVDQRVELIKLQAFTMSMDDAVATGLANRLDLMNAKARVTDARRQVEIAANRLEAVLDVRLEGDVRTPTGNKPLDFRGTASSFRAGIAFTAPIDQISERNAYRAALINYQRARRTYMAFEDQVKFRIRQNHRSLTVLEKNFETTRQALRRAAQQFDLSVENATAPPRPGQVATTESQGLNLLNALRAVLNAQNDLIGIWVQYEQSRLNIYRDMGIMEIDARGIWTDSLYQHGQPPQGSTDETRRDNAANGVFDGRVGRSLADSRRADGSPPACRRVGYVVSAERDGHAADGPVFAGISGERAAQPPTTPQTRVDRDRHRVGDRRGVSGRRPRFVRETRR